MSYCINPDCARPQNEAEDKICRNCGSKLLLRERYRVVRVLGQGGFGRTYLAIDQDRLNASCVIKQFLPQMQGTEALEKATELFNQEAVRLYDLGVHPQIPDLLAFFVQDKRQYLVQEFIPGMNLQKLLERHGKFSEAEIWSILRSILPILDFVHQRQVIHRDIKPDNIIRRQGDNLLYLIDFGVAKLLSSPDRVLTGTSIGTSGYVPLEQMSEGKAYPASDIYSLGVTCFHLLTGVNPYNLFLKRGYSWLQTWHSYVKEEASSKLIQVLDRMMREDRKERYSSALDALQDIDQTKEVELRQATEEDEEYITNFLKDLVITSPNREEAISDNLFAEVTTKATEILPTEEQVSLSNPPEPTEDDEFITEFILDISTANIEIDPPSPVQSKAQNVVYEVDTVSQIWRCERTIYPHEQGCCYVAITPNGTIVTAGVRKVVKLWNLESGVAKGTLIKEDTCSTCGGLGKVFKENAVFFVKTKQSITCPDCEGFGTNSEKGERFVTAKLSADGSTLVTSTLDKYLKLWSLSNNKFKQSFSTEPSVASIVSISSNGRILCYALQNRTIIIYDTELQQEVGKLRINGIVTCLDINSEGKIIILGTEEGGINLWDVTSGLPPLNVKGHHSGITTVALSCDGMMAVSGCRDGMVKVWNLGTGNLVHTFKQHLTSITAMAIGADNLTLATGSQDGCICVWHLARGQLIETFAAHTDRVTAIAGGADGQTFASSSLDGTVKIWRSI